jgi:hypothetical protein
MEVDLRVNRECLQWARPKFFFFITFEVFPNMRSNSQYPGAPAKITALEAKFGLFAEAHGAKKTSLADEIYEEILTDTSGLMKYTGDNCDNNLPKLQSSGFIAVKTTRTPEPLTGKVENVHSMSLGGERMKFEYEADDAAHYFLARVRLKGGTDADWVMNGRSETKTMFISTGLSHGLEYEIQICGNGTKGEGLWSDVKTFIVD